MNFVVEQQRALHAEQEFLVRNAAQALLQRTKRDGLLADTRAADLLALHQLKAKQLLALYADTDHSRESEIQALTTTNDDISAFDRALKEIQASYASQSWNEFVAPTDLELDTRDLDAELEALESRFSGEEGLGRYLDLTHAFQAFLNLKGARKGSYLSYLEEFAKFDEAIPMETRKSGEYKSYVNDLCTYLESFLVRSQPLLNMDKEQQDVKKEFESRWTSDPEFLKEWKGDANDGLYCQACQKGFAKETVFESHKSGKKHIKAQEALQRNSSGGPLNNNNSHKDTAEKEYYISHYVTSLLGEVIEETLGHVERKQTLTEKERLEDAEEEVIDISDAESDSSEKIYNPLKLPLGWDGKPIPYWLYKLHGLGVEYTCEICGNYVYMGRKAFEKHFSEWRHIQGLKCLGISTSKHFQEITSIKDAVALWDRLQKDSKTARQTEETMEEFEDDQGNVFSKKTYEDLKRQGLI